MDASHRRWCAASTCACVQERVDSLQQQNSTLEDELSRLSSMREAHGRCGPQPDASAEELVREEQSYAGNGDYGPAHTEQLSGLKRPRPSLLPFSSAPRQPAADPTSRSLRCVTEC